MSSSSWLRSKRPPTSNSSPRRSTWTTTVGRSAGLCEPSAATPDEVANPRGLRDWEKVTKRLGARREESDVKRRGRPSKTYPRREELATDAARAWEKLWSYVRSKYAKKPARTEGWYGTQAGSVFVAIFDVAPEAKERQGGCFITPGASVQAIGSAVGEALDAASPFVTTVRVVVFRAGTAPTDAGAWTSKPVKLGPQPLKPTKKRIAYLARVKRLVASQVKRRLGKAVRFDLGPCIGALYCLLPQLNEKQKGRKGTVAVVAELAFLGFSHGGRWHGREKTTRGTYVTPAKLRAVERYLDAAKTFIDRVRGMAEADAAVLAEHERILEARFAGRPELFPLVVVT